MPQRRCADAGAELLTGSIDAILALRVRATTRKEPGAGGGTATVAGGSGGSTTWKAFTSVEAAAWGSMVAVTVSVAVAPTAIDPMFQAPVVASKVPIPLVFALTKLAPAGSESEDAPSEPVTANGSLPATLAAPPLSVQPVRALPKLPPGSSQ